MAGNDPPTGSANVPPWKEDDNSPFSASGSDAHTYTISGDYDEVAVAIDAQNCSIAGGDEFRLNGVTSGWDYTSSTGSTTQNVGGWVPTNATRIRNIEAFVLRLRGDKYINARVVPGYGIIGSYTETASVRDANELSSFTVRDSGSSNFQIRARVYGRKL